MKGQKDLDFQVAQLRHAYAQLKSGPVRDQREFADGLIAPAIRFLEAMEAQRGSAEALLGAVGDGASRQMAELRRACAELCADQEPDNRDD
jgi:hypothetical protein